MSNKYYKLCLLLVGVSIITGCNPLSGNGQGMQPETKTNEYVQNKKTYNFTEGNLTVDVEMIIPEDLILTRSTAEEYPLLNAVPYIKKKYVDKNWHETRFDSFDENGDSQESYEWLYGELDNLQKRISIYPYGLTLTEDMEASFKITDSFRLQGQEYPNFEKYKRDDSLECQNNILKAINNDLDIPQLNIMSFDSFINYELDRENMEEESGRVNVLTGEFEKIDHDWSEDDNYYRFYARQTHQGLPIFYTDGELGCSLSVECMPCNGLVRKENMQLCELFIERVYSFEESDKIISLLGQDEIIEIVKSRYNDLMTDNKFYIDKAELMYYVQSDFSESKKLLIPVWVFEVYEEDSVNKGDNSYDLFMIDATSGEEVYIN